MLHRYLILHGLQKLIPAKFREKYSELALGRRRRRQDVAADEEQQKVSASRLLKTWYPIFKTIHKQDCSRRERILKDHFCYYT
jgi:hypothetical protein